MEMEGEGKQASTVAVIRFKCSQPKGFPVALVIDCIIYSAQDGFLLEFDVLLSAKFACNLHLIASALPDNRFLLLFSLPTIALFLNKDYYQYIEHVSCGLQFCNDMSKHLRFL